MDKLVADRVFNRKWVKKSIFFSVNIALYVPSAFEIVDGDADKKKILDDILSDNRFPLKIKILMKFMAEHV